MKVRRLFNMELKADGWYHYNSTIKKEEKVAPAIMIADKYKDYDTNEHTIKIEDDSGNVHQGTLDMLNSRNIDDLTKYGFLITPQNKNLLSGALLKMAHDMPPETVYESIGLIIKEDDIRYHGHELISNNGETGKLNPDAKFSLKPKGTLKEWASMFNKHVKGSPYLELGVALGVTGILISYYKKQGVDLHTPLVHFYADSSKGKTTLAQLILSVAGHPGKTDGLFKNWNNTNVAMIDIVSDNWGIPILFDEVSTQNTNFTQLLYTLSEGIERGRANQDGRVKKQKNWATIILSTGEAGLNELDSAKRNTGMGVRMLQFNAIFTKNATQSESIKRIIEKHHGHVLPHIAKEIIETDKNVMLELFDDKRKKFIEALEGTSEFANRVSNLYAVISVAALSFNSTFEKEGMVIDEDGLFDLLVEYEQQVSKTRDLGQEAYETLIQYLITNQQKIADEKNTFPPNSGTLGFHSTDSNDNKVIKILKTAFEDFIKNNQFESPINVSKALKNKGYFITSTNDRTASQETIHGERTACYTLKIEPEYHELFNALKAIDDNNPFKELVKNSNQSSGISKEAASVFQNDSINRERTIEDDLKGL